MSPITIDFAVYLPSARICLGYWHIFANVGLIPDVDSHRYTYLLEILEAVDKIRKTPVASA